MNKNPDSPYIGPRPFHKDERHLFFGRDREARDLTALVFTEKLVLFYAQSGAGKSSLINTRLIPELEHNLYEVLPVARVSGDRPPGIYVENIFVYNLMRSMIKREIDPKSIAKLSLKDYLGKLNEDENGYFYDPNLDTSIRGGPETPVWPRALIIDQFEEILTTNQDSWGKREGFFRQLADAMQADPQLWVVLAMREDHIAGLDPYAHLLPDGLRMRYYMERLSTKRAIEAVEGPAKEFHRTYAEGAAEKLARALSRVNVRGPDNKWVAKDGQYVEPVQLQVVCSSLWGKLIEDEREISNDRVKEHVKDLNQALGKFYADRVNEVASGKYALEKGIKERDIRRWFEKELILDGKRRNMVAQEHGGNSGGLDDLVVQEFLGSLVREEKRGGGATFYELTHDRMVEPIIENNRQYEEQHFSPLQRQAALWDEQGQDDRWLLSDQALENVRQWAHDNPGEVGKIEEEFLQECDKHQVQIDAERLSNERNRKLLRAATIFAVVASFMLVVSALLGIQSYRNQRTTQMQILINGSSIELEKANAETNPIASQYYKDLAARLAYQALVRFGKTNGEPEQALANVVDPMGETVSNQAPFIILSSDVAVNTIAFHPGGKTFAAGYSDGNIFLVNVDTYLAIGEPLNGHTSQVNSVTFSGEGSVLASGSDDYTVRLWDMETGKEICQLTGHTDAVKTVAFSTDSNLLASGSADSSVILWDVATCKPAGQTLRGHTTTVASVAFSPDGKILASGSWDNTITLWDIETGQPIMDPLTGHTDWVQSIAFSPDGRTLASASDDSTVRLWEVETGKEIRQLSTIPNNYLTSLAFSPDGTTVAYADGWGGTIRLWNVLTGEVFDQFTGHQSSVKTVAFSPDGTVLATGGMTNSEIILWDVAMLQQIKTLSAFDLAETTSVESMAFTSDGNILAIPSGYFGHLWDKETNVTPIPIELSEVENNPVYHQESFGSFIYAISPDGKYRVDQYSNSVLDTETNREVVRINSSIEAVAFGPKSRFVSSAANGTISIWEIDSGRRVASIDYEKDAGVTVTSLAFSPDESRIAVALNDGKNTVEVWDIGSKQKMLIIADRQFQSLGYTVASPRITGSKPRPQSDDQRQDESTSNPVADLYFSSEGLFILYHFGAFDRWDIWISRAELESKVKKEHCQIEACDLTIEERLNYSLYTLPMQVYDYATPLIVMMYLLLYGICIRAVYRFVFVHPVDSFIVQGFLWKKFLLASALGGMLIATSLLIWLLITNIEQIYYPNEGRYADAGTEWLPLLIVPLGLWAGGAYSHFTRFQSGKLSRTKRTLIGSVAGLLGGLVGSILAVVVLGLFYDLYLSLEDYVSLGGIAGLAAGLLSLFGALIYIFWLHPLSSEGKLSRNTIVWTLHLLFGVGLFFVHKQAKRKWLYPVAVLAMLSLWLLVIFDLDYRYLGGDFIGDNVVTWLGLIGLIVHLVGLFDLGSITTDWFQFWWVIWLIIPAVMMAITWAITITGEPFSGLLLGLIISAIITTRILRARKKIRPKMDQDATSSVS